MKLTLIVSSNSNPTYLQFAPIQKEACRHLGIDFYLCTTGADGWEVGESEARIPTLEGLPDVFTAQIARYILPAFFPDRHFIVGDIDMLILSRSFIGRIKAALKGHEGILFTDSDTYDGVLRYPCCYYAGRGEAFARVLGMESPDPQAFAGLASDIWSRGEHWTSDEYFFTEMAELMADRVPIRHLNDRMEKVFLGRRKLRGRVNREQWKPSRLGLVLDRYVDAHCPRPIHAHLPELRHILNYICCGMEGRNYLLYEMGRLLLGRKDLFLNHLPAGD